MAGPAGQQAEQVPHVSERLGQAAPVAGGPPRLIFETPAETTGTDRVPVERTK
jgi:hypothetical protein